MAKKKTANPGQQLKQLNDLIGGIGAGAPAGVTEMGVGGSKFAMPDLLTKLTGYRDVYAAVARAEAALAVAIEARDAVNVEATKFLRQTRKAVKSALGGTSATNKSYGITPDKEAAPLPADKLVTRNAKAAATRVARGTKGKRQKAQIHGEVPASPAPASPTPSPAASATSSPAASPLVAPRPAA